MGKEEVTMDSHMEVEDDASFQLDETKEENLVEEAMNVEEDTSKQTKKRRTKKDTIEENDLEDSDLFNLIDSMYEKRDDE